jgi:hypothetical protein
MSRAGVSDIEYVVDAAEADVDVDVDVDIHFPRR